MKRKLAILSTAIFAASLVAPTFAQTSLTTAGHEANALTQKGSKETGVAGEAAAAAKKAEASVEKKAEAEVEKKAEDQAKRAVTKLFKKKKKHHKTQSNTGAKNGEH